MAEEKKGAIKGAVIGGTTAALVGGGIAAGTAAALGAMIPGGEDLAAEIKEITPTTQDLTEAYEGVKQAILGSVDYAASDYSPKAMEAIDQLKESINTLNPSEYGQGASIVDFVQNEATSLLENPNFSDTEKEALATLKTSLQSTLESPEIQDNLKPIGKAIVDNGNQFAESAAEGVDAAKSLATKAAGITGAGVAGTIGAGVGAGTGSSWVAKEDARRQAQGAERSV